MNFSFGIYKKEAWYNFKSMGLNVWYVDKYDHLTSIRYPAQNSGDLYNVRVLLLKLENLSQAGI